MEGVRFGHAYSRKASWRVPPPRPPNAGVPLVYQLDDDMKPIPQEGAVAPLSGRYLGDPEKLAAEIAAVAAQASAKK